MVVSLPHPRDSAPLVKVSYSWKWKCAAVLAATLMKNSAIYLFQKIMRMLHLYFIQYRMVCWKTHVLHISAALSSQILVVKLLGLGHI